MTKFDHMTIEELRPRVESARLHYDDLGERMRDNPDCRVIRWDYKQAQALSLRLDALLKQKETVDDPWKGELPDV